MASMGVGTDGTVGKIDAAAACAQIDVLVARGDLFAAYSKVQEARRREFRSAKLDYQEVLILARMGDADEAMRRYDALGLAGHDDVDAKALKARISKDRAFRLPADARLGALQAAADEYAEISRRTGEIFPLVNAATLALLAGDENAAKERAAAVLRHAAGQVPSSYWSFASKAEAELVLGRTDDAEITLADAARQQDASAGAKSSTIRQLNLLLDGLGTPTPRKKALLGRLGSGPVAHYCGHIFAPDAQAESLLAARIDALLEQHRIDIGCGSLAAGSDILVAERILARGGEVHVILPFEQSAFVAMSVTAAGSAWRSRFEACLAAATDVTTASAMGYVGDERQFTHGARVAMGIAKLRANHLCSDVVQIALWDGQPSASPAGTASDVEHWRALGGDTLVVKTPPLVRTVAPHHDEPDQPTRAAHAILFSDFAGFSRITEQALPTFWHKVMQRAGSILAKHRGTIHFQNSWGDAIYAVIEDAASAAELALDLQDAWRGSARAAEPGDISGMRLALHYGTMYAGHDPIIGRTNYYGTEVSRAARLEPVTPPGSIYVTEPFAAILAMEAPRAYNTSYAGQIDLAKAYGVNPVYRLTRAG